MNPTIYLLIGFVYYFAGAHFASNYILSCGDPNEPMTKKDAIGAVLTFFFWPITVLTRYVKYGRIRYDTQ